MDPVTVRSELVKWMLCNDFSIQQVGEALPYLSQLVLNGTTDLKPPVASPLTDD